MPAATQSPSKSTRADELLSLRDAAQVMGVHPATLRVWADRGRVASQRTAGGHRRFRRADLQASLERQQVKDAGVDVLVHSALGRMRMEMENLDAPWLARVDEETRRFQRELGRRLLQQIAQALSLPELTDDARVAAADIGGEYAALTQRLSLSLTEAVRAFLFFRDALVGSLVQMASSLEPIASSGWLSVHRQLCLFLNEVLLALVKVYEVEDE